MESTRVTGIVQSGRGDGALPLAGAWVTLFQAGDHPPDAIWSTRTDAAGRFSLQADHPTCEGVFYVTACTQMGVLFRVIVGPALPASITLNELTTVAAAFSTARLTESGDLSGDPSALRIASGMNDDLVSPRTGHESEVLLAPPNGGETGALRTLRSLGNLLAACARDIECAPHTLRVLTTPPDGENPRDTFEALVNIALDPARNATGIWTLSQWPWVYEPSLQDMPDAWTLDVKGSGASG
jgi:hypothetical protein